MPPTPGKQGPQQGGPGAAPGGQARGLPTSDVLVVGAGVIGLACAWRAAQRGMSVCVIDRHAPGSGTSRVAAGMLAPVGEASWGEESLLELNLASASAYPRFAAELEEAAGSGIDYRRHGALHVALDRDEEEELRRRHRYQEGMGLETEWIGPWRCRELEPGLATACSAGVHAREDASVDPRALVDALVLAAERAGVTVIPNAEAAAALIESDRLRGVRTADGRVLRAGQVVLACGPWSGRPDWLPAGVVPPVRPVKGQVLYLRGNRAHPLCERIVATQRVYVAPRGDGRIVVGATVEEQSFDTTVTAGAAHELLRECCRVLPEAAELELLEVVAGLRPATPDNSPVIGRGALDGLVLATGHFRNGILLTPITADAVAALLSGDEPPGPVAPMALERLGPPASRR
ncbi:MAG: glycine oxidase ThiO [bacterium]